MFEKSSSLTAFIGLMNRLSNQSNLKASSNKTNYNHINGGVVLKSITYHVSILCYILFYLLRSGKLIAILCLCCWVHYMFFLMAFLYYLVQALKLEIHPFTENKEERKSRRKSHECQIPKFLASKETKLNGSIWKIVCF